MTTIQGTKYVLIIIEHFSKWIELMALPQNSSKLAAFLDYVLAIYVAPTKILIYQRRELIGSFE